MDQWISDCKSQSNDLEFLSNNAILCIHIYIVRFFIGLRSAFITLIPMIKRITLICELLVYFFKKKNFFQIHNEIIVRRGLVLYWLDRENFVRLTSTSVD